MSKRDNDRDMPRYVKQIIKAMNAADLPVDGIIIAEVKLGMGTPEQLEQIQRWESRREELTERFCSHIASAFIDLQYMSVMFEGHDEPAAGELVADVGELLDLAGGNQVLVGLAATVVKDIVNKVKAAQAAIAKEMTGAETNGEPEPGTKDKNETVDAAKARLRAAYKAAQRNGRANCN